MLSSSRGHALLDRLPALAPQQRAQCRFRAVLYATQLRSWSCHQKERFGSTPGCLSSCLPLQLSLGHPHGYLRKWSWQLPRPLAPPPFSRLPRLHQALQSRPLAC